MSAPDASQRMEGVFRHYAGGHVSEALRAAEEARSRWQQAGHGARPVGKKQGVAQNHEASALGIDGASCHGQAPNIRKARGEDRRKRGFYRKMASERTDELYRLLLEKGYPKEFCAEIAYKNMNTDYTATRMLGYLYRVSDPRIEDLVDEMLAILSDRDQIVRKKELERAQAAINEMYRNGQQIF